MIGAVGIGIEPELELLLEPAVVSVASTLTMGGLVSVTSDASGPAEELSAGSLVGAVVGETGVVGTGWLAVASMLPLVDDLKGLRNR